MTDKAHRDDLVKQICDLARECGYGVTEIELIGRNTSLGLPPVHRYRAAAQSQNFDGTVSVTDLA